MESIGIFNSLRSSFLLINYYYSCICGRTLTVSPYLKRSGNVRHRCTNEICIVTRKMRNLCDVWARDGESENVSALAGFCSSNWNSHEKLNGDKVSSCSALDEWIFGVDNHKHSLCLFDVQSVSHVYALLKSLNIYLNAFLPSLVDCVADKFYLIRMKWSQKKELSTTDASKWEYSYYEIASVSVERKREWRMTFSGKYDWSAVIQFENHGSPLLFRRRRRSENFAIFFPFAFVCIRCMAAVFLSQEIFICLNGVDVYQLIVECALKSWCFLSFFWNFILCCFFHIQLCVVYNDTQTSVCNDATTWNIPANNNEWR